MNHLTSLIEESTCLPSADNYHSNSKQKFPTEIIAEDPEEGKNDEENKFDKELFSKNLIKIQRFAKMKKDQKMYKQMKKKLHHRKCILAELIKTEENFKNSLFCVIERIINPLKILRIIKKEDEIKLFSNIESIASFSETFHIALCKKFNYNYENTKTKFAETVLTLIPFFKLYFEYCHNYQGAMNQLAVLKKNNKKFVEFLENIELTQEFEHQDLKDQLIKPIQRLPKYVLLFKDLLKNTEKIHPDYQNIENALKRFQKINNDNDKKILQKVRIFELQEQYGSSLTFSIPEAQREFLEEESLVLLTDKKTLNVIVYFLTDLMLVTEQNFTENKLIKHLTFDYNSYVRDMTTTRYFKWSITIFGKEGGVLFIFESKEAKIKILEFLNLRIFSELKAKIRSKISMYPKSNVDQYIKNKDIKFEVLGSIPRGLEHIKPYTVYVVQIEFEKIIYKLFLRYKELLILQETVNKDFPDLKLSQLAPKHFWTEQKSKTIVSRKFHIESFLRSVLNNEQIMHNKERVLEKLGLPNTFYTIENINEEVNQKNKDWIEMVDNLNSIRLKKKKSVYRCFINYLKSQKKLYFPLENDPMTKLKSKTIEVMLSDKRKIRVEITQNTRTFDVCRHIAEEIGLASWLDFKLCLRSSSMDESIIQDDEFVWKALDLELDEETGNFNKFEVRPSKIKTENKPIPISNDHKNNKNNEIEENNENEKNQEKENDKNKQNANNGNNDDVKSFKAMWSLFKTTVSNVFQSLVRKNLYCNSELIFKKPYNLPHEIEEIDYKTDNIRLDLMISQILFELQQNRLCLSFNDYCLFGSLIVYMNYGPIYLLSPIGLENLFKTEILPKAIPALILYQMKFDFWFNNIAWYWKNFSDEINKIIELNQKYNDHIGEKMLQNLIKKQQFDTSKKPIDGKIIAKYVMLNCVFKTSLFGTHRFFCNMLDEEKKNESKAFWLSISFENIKFLEVKSCKELKKIMYDEIEQISTLPSNIEISLKGEKISCYTIKGFEIKEIFEVYKRMRIILITLGKKMRKSKNKGNKEKDNTEKFKKSGFFN